MDVKNPLNQKACSPSKTYNGNTLRTSAKNHPQRKCNSPVTAQRCPECGIIFGKLSHLIAHTFDHTGDWPYRCNVCRKGYAYASTLQKHMLKHIGSNSNSACLSPNKNDGNSAKINGMHFSLNKPFTGIKHVQRVNAGVLDNRKKPHILSSYVNESVPSYQLYLKRLSSRKKCTPRKCPLCGKKFNRARHLKVHTFSHTKRWPIKCSSCEMGFAYASSFNSHATSHMEAAYAMYRCVVSVYSSAPNIKLCPSKMVESLTLPKMQNISNQAKNLHVFGDYSVQDIEPDLIDKKPDLNELDGITMASYGNGNFSSDKGNFDISAYIQGLSANITTNGIENDNSGFVAFPGSDAKSGRVQIAQNSDFSSTPESADKTRMEESIGKHGEDITFESVDITNCININDAEIGFKLKIEGGLDDIPDMHATQSDLRKLSVGALVTMERAEESDSDQTIDYHEEYDIEDSSKTTSYLDSNAGYKTTEQISDVTHSQGQHINRRKGSPSRLKKWSCKSHTCACGMAFTTAAHLRAHSYNHTGAWPFKCSICMAGFAWASSLQKHGTTRCNSSSAVSERQLNNSTVLMDQSSKTTCRKSLRHSASDKGISEASNVEWMQSQSDKNQHECALCGKAYYRAAILRAHVRNVHGEHVHVCDVCGYKANSTGHLKRHMTTHTGDKQHVCLICGKKFAERFHLKKHAYVHSGERPFNCSVCNKGYISSMGLKIHSYIHTGETPYLCPTCGKGFATAARLKFHNYVHTGEKFYACDKCGKEFLMIGHLNRHLETHREVFDRPHKCMTCPKGFRTHGELKRHALIHKIDKPFNCEVCGKGFNTAFDWRTHNYRHTGERPFKCNVCNKGFTRVAEVQRHRILHKGNVSKDHLCSHCGKGFFKLSHLQRHATTHDEENREKCPICSEEFRLPRSLKKHMFLHTGVKEHVCGQCGAAFRILSSLQKHMTTHSGIKKCLCSICGKAFSCKASVQSHMSVHTGEKPYVCEECGKSFRKSSGLKYHSFIHTGERPFSCNFCSKGFNDPSSLRKHKTTHKSCT